MKHFTFLVAIGVAICSTTSANGAICMTFAQCAGNLQNMKDNYACCPTEKTTYSCPTGWRASGGICKRSNTDAGSDDKGYMATTYGTCDATQTTNTCYMISATGCL